MGFTMVDGEKASPPWGNWSVLDSGVAFKVKRIEVLPGRRLSYQKHMRREEHWYIIQGRAIVTLEGREQALSEGESFNIARGVFHRIENPGGDLLVFIEVQRGEYFGEDDIVRLADDYGRT
jgi:mannose-6-phosphate isomerase